MQYRPKPIEASESALSADILELTEILAENAHETWASQRLADGWRFGPQRDDSKKEHPSLIRYAELSESEKEYDRRIALDTLRAIQAAGYRIEKA